MTRPTWRAWQAATVDELTPHTGVGKACELVGRSRATHHRQTHPKPKMFGPHPKPRHPAELSPEEREQILAVLNSDDYANSSVAQAWACELDEGRYWCSQRTMYRILQAAGQCGERRRQATHPPRTIPELVAEAPNAVWSWDITKLAGPARGILVPLLRRPRHLLPLRPRLAHRGRRGRPPRRGPGHRHHHHPRHPTRLAPRRRRPRHDLQTVEFAAGRPRRHQVA